MKTEDLTLISEVRLLVRTGEAKRIRQDAGVTLGEIARAIGVAASTVARWEARTRTPRGTAAIRYRRILNDLARARGGS